MCVEKCSVVVNIYTATLVQLKSNKYVGYAKKLLSLLFLELPSIIADLHSR